jgi:ParB-like chromosome segregation protein Spo0J
MTIKRRTTKSVKLADIDPTYATQEENPNKMEPERFDLLVKAMELHGDVQPVLSARVGDRYQLIDGHHRVWAALKLGLSAIESTVIENATEAEIAALSIAMNRLRGDLDLRASSDIIKDIIESTGWEIGQVSIATGFTADEITALLGDTAMDAEDMLRDSADMGEAEAKPEKPYVLELAFADRETFKLVKRRLRKASGETKDLAQGLLHLIGEE